MSTTQSAIKRRQGACEVCKVKKIKCDGSAPCTACEKSGNHCRYGFTGRRRHKRQSSHWGIQNTATQILKNLQSDMPLQSGTPGETHAIRPTRRDRTPDYFSSEVKGFRCSSASPVFTPARTGAQSQEPFPFLQIEDLFDVAFQEQENQGNYIGVVPDASRNRVQYSYEASMFYDPLLEQVDNTDPSTGVLDLKENLSEAKQGVASSSGHLIPAELPSLNLDYSLLELDMNESKLSVAQNTETVQIFQALQSALCPLSRKEIKVEYYIQELFAQDLVERFCSACWNEPYGVATFLDRSFVSNTLQGWSEVSKTSMIDDLGRSKTFRTFGLALAAIGSHIESQPKLSLEFFSAAMDSRQCCHFNSLFALQTELMLLYYSEKANLASYSPLLSNAVSLAQNLRLNSLKITRGQFADPATQTRARRAFWFLYSIEVPYSVSRNIFPLLRSHDIDHSPPLALDDISRHETVDWLHVKCQYAKIYENIHNEFYSRSAHVKDFRGYKLSAQKLQDELKDWAATLPPRFQTIGQGSTFSWVNDPAEITLGLQLLSNYHQMVWTIEQARCKASQDLTAPVVAEADQDIAVASGRIVLRFCWKLTTTIAAGLERSFLYTVLVALRVLFLGVVRGQSPQSDLSYLGLVSGFLTSVLAKADQNLMEKTINLIAIAQDATGIK